MKRNKYIKDDGLKIKMNPLLALHTTSPVRQFYGSATNHLELGIWAGLSVPKQISPQALCLNNQACNSMIHFSSCIIIIHRAPCIMQHGVAPSKIVPPPHDCAYSPHPLLCKKYKCFFCDERSLYFIHIMVLSLTPTIPLLSSAASIMTSSPKAGTI